MEKSLDDKPYQQPTREALVRSMHSDGLYIGVCRFCKQKIRGSSLKELQDHKCDNGKT